MDRNLKKVDWKNLNSFCEEVLLKIGVDRQCAEIVADSITTAELSGFHSHGIVRLPHYVKRLKIGSINPKPKIRVVKKSGNTVIVDGDDGMGHAVAHFAMNEVIKLAKNGVAFAGIRRSSHFGIAGYFTLQAAQKNMIGIAFTHTDASVIPFGGKKPIVGTNPISIAVPTNREYSVVLDMSTSAAALGKIIVARKKGEKIPDSWAVDKDGNPTTDPNNVKYLMPMAGPKGYGLAFIIDILCGPLTGALFGAKLPLMYGDYDKHRELGHFLGAINIEHFVPVDEFKKNVDIMIDDVHNIPPAEGFKNVMVPGEIEYLASLRQKKEGISIPDETLKELESMAKEINTEFSLKFK